MIVLYWLHRCCFVALMYKYRKGKNNWIYPFSAGFSHYLLKVETGDEVVTEKFVKCN